MNKKLILKLVVITFLILFISQTTKAVTLAELQAQINTLLLQIKQIQEQFRQIQNLNQKTWCHDFNVDLKIGDKGDEVTALYNALYREGLVVERGSNFQHIFDEVVASAVSGFQQKYADDVLKPLDLKYGTGFVGKYTRAKLNELYGCKKTTLKPSFPLNISSPTISSPNQSPTCKNEPGGTPIITSLSTYSGPVGTKLEIRGCNLSGFEGDKNVWIENNQGTKGILYGEIGSTSNLIKVTLNSPLCQKDVSYSGIPCDAWLDLLPGTYKIYVMPWGKKSNEVNFTITP